MNIDDKKKIIDYLYDNVHLNNLKFFMMKNELDLNLLTYDHYYMLPLRIGIPCLLIIKRIERKHYMVIIEKKNNLSFDRNKIDYESLTIDNITINVDSSFYNGTILDGIFYKRKNTNEKIFYTQDILCYKDENLVGRDIRDKFNIAKMDINKLFNIENMKNRDDIFNNIRLVEENIYNLDDIYQFFEENVGNCKGVVFIPKLYGQHENGFFKKKLLFAYTVECSQMIRCDSSELYRERKRKEHKNMIEFSTNSKNIVCVCNKVKAKLLSRKVDGKPDVYDLFSIKKDDIFDKYIKIKMGIAYISCLEMSQKLFERSVDKSELIVNCEYNKSYNKWEPKSIDDKTKVPSLYTDIMKNFELINC